MNAYIVEHSLLVFALVMVAAALFHWFLKVRKGQATPDFLAYLFNEMPGYSAGTFGALILAWWLVYTTEGLKGMAPHMVVETAFMTGYFIDSAISAGGGK